jgi:hypothetical protein
MPPDGGVADCGWFNGVEQNLSADADVGSVVEKEKRCLSGVEGDEGSGASLVNGVEKDKAGANEEEGATEVVAEPGGKEEIVEVLEVCWEKCGRGGVEP